jgi:hypothetical protein
MFNSWGVGGRRKILLAALSVTISFNAFGATVGQLAGNSSIWANPGNFSNIYVAATVGAGHTVESAETLTAQNIANNTHFIVESSATALAAQELSLLVDYVRGGGTLLLFATPTTGVTSANQILSALGPGLSGTTMSVQTMTSGFPGTSLNWGSLSGSDPAVQGTVANLNGQSLNYTQTRLLMGGTHLAVVESPSISDAIRVDRYQLGRVYLFGTHIDSNTVTGVNQYNTQFFLNILANGGLPSGLVDTGVPEPSTFGLSAVTLAGALLYLRRKRT